MLTLIHTTERTLSENGDKIPAEDKVQIEADIASLKEILDSDDADEIKARTDALYQSSMKIGEHLYKQETPAPEGAKPYIDVAFGQRFEGQTRILNSTRWPVDNRNRGYVFFYFDAQGKRVTYRAVDEFVPPDEPKRDG